MTERHTAKRSGVDAEGGDELLAGPLADGAERANPDTPQHGLPAALLASLNSAEVVPFLGAGVSQPMPSALPSASDLASSLVAMGYGDPGDDLEEVAEKCWIDGGWQRFARVLPSEEWRAAPPNVCHVVVAELASEGLIRIVLTTNWDNLIETAFNACGVPFAPIARPEDLAVVGEGRAQIVKLHGSIDTPETIRARRSDVDSEEWAAEWVGALIATVLRTKSVLFAGYSGASRAATKTITKIASENARVALDWMVGRSRFTEAIQRERTGELVSALGASEERYVEMDAVVFFAELRRQMYPLLLQRPKQHAQNLLTSLFEPTSMSADAPSETLASLLAIWTSGGQERAQALLQRSFPLRVARPYVPIIPNSADIGRYWAWVTIASAAGAVSVDEETFEAARPPAAGLGRVRVVPVICGSTDRRDQATAAALSLLAGGAGGPVQPYLGIVVGGTGPIAAPAAPYNVARGTATGDVVRGGAINVTWESVDALFELATPGIAPEAFAGAVTTYVDTAVARLATGAPVA